MRFLTLLLVFLSGFLFADVTTTHGKLKLIHARATQTKEAVRIAISQPGEGQVLDGPDVTVKFTTQNWPMEQNGNHLHFLIDNEPAQMHYSSNEFVFRNVAPGPHLIRVFPVYSWHESVKQQEALVMVRFYVKDKTGTLPVDPRTPMLIYSTPVGEHPSNEKLPDQPQAGVLIDWFQHNVELGSRTGYLVNIYVDGERLTSMKEWRPHYVQGLEPGEHRIKLELTKNGKAVTENWSTTERVIRVRE